MTRCQHNKEVIAYEEYVTTTAHHFHNGQYASSDSTEDGSGDYNGIIHIHCTQCDKMWTFNRFVSLRGLKRIPQWVQEYAERAGIPFCAVRR